MFLRFLILVLAVSVKAKWYLNSKLEEVFRWQQVDFQFPNDTIRDFLLTSERYIQAENNILGLEVWRDKLFLTVPRWFTGTGSTLNYVMLDSSTKSPSLIPYPDYDTNDIYNGNLDDKIVSTTRLFVDSCDRLWVIDTGKENIFGASQNTLSSDKLLIYDLTTDTLLRKVLIGNDVKNVLSMLYEVTVDITNNECDTAYAYLADTLGYAILVYSWETNTFRRVSNTYFYFEPQSSIFGNIQFNDGVMGLALSPQNPDGFKTLYFHALASTYEYNVSTQVLKDPSLSSDFTRFHFMGSRGTEHQSSTSRFDAESGVLFYTLLKRNGIGCWNSRNAPYYNSRTNAVAGMDRRRISFPSAMTLDRQRNVWVLSNNILNFAAKTLNPAEYNYRVFKAPVDRLIQYNVCDREYNPYYVY